MVNCVNADNNNFLDYTYVNFKYISLNNFLLKYIFKKLDIANDV